MAKVDLYLVLGIPRDASGTAIRTAYRRLAKEHHPDRVGTSRSERFRHVSEAYSVLSDPDRRRRYDATLEPIGGASHWDLPSEPTREQGLDGDVSLRNVFDRSPWRVGEEFGDWTRRSVVGAPPKSGRRALLELDVVLSPDEAALGGRVRLRIPTPVPCASCSGSGQTWLYVCGACNGEGVFARDTTLVVRIPAGVRDGTVWDLAEIGLGTNLRLHMRIDSSW